MPRASIKNLKSKEHTEDNEQNQTTMETPKQKAKRQFDYMTSAVLKEREQRVLAGVHFSALGGLMFIISATVTLFQAVLATVAQANLGSDHIQSIANVTIAVFSAFSVFWQSLVKHWDYPGQAGLNNAAASALEKLYHIALLRAREEAASVYGEMVQQHDGSGSVGSGRNGDDAENAKGGDVTGTIAVTLTKQFEQAIEGSPEVPIRIATAFDILDTRIMVGNKKIVKGGGGAGGGDYKRTDVAWEKVYPALYHQLTTEIIQSRGWPYFLPQPEDVVNKAIAKFEKLDACLLSSLLDRNEEITKSYELFEAKKQQQQQQQQQNGAASQESKQEQEPTETTPLMSMA